MFKVSRKSWHYRLHTFVFTMFDLEHGGPIDYWTEGYRYIHRPKSLCTYFWSTLILTILLPIWTIFFTIATIVIVIGYFVFYKPHEKYREFRPKKQSNKQPGIVKTFIKAKKNKVCPLIELTD